MSKLNNINYVHDALRERLPAGWSLNRTEANGSALYRWTNWRTGQYLVAEVLEGYTDPIKTTNELCDSLMAGVLEEFTNGATAPLAFREQWGRKDD